MPGMKGFGSSSVLQIGLFLSSLKLAGACCPEKDCPGLCKLDSFMFSFKDSQMGMSTHEHNPVPICDQRRRK